MLLPFTFNLVILEIRVRHSYGPTRETGAVFLEFLVGKIARIIHLWKFARWHGTMGLRG